MNQTIKEMAGVELVNGPFESMTGDEQLMDLSVYYKTYPASSSFVSYSVHLKMWAVQLASLITGKVDINSNQQLVEDCFGELLNMTVGSAQRKRQLRF